ncbi:MAG TPA: hypothetical protein VFN65_11210 [Solirubrobacteraceae bacterium]|nr:hypothetical protein [Solirubrobacteraceae bacterium]
MSDHTHDEDHEELADELDEQAETLSQRSEELEDKIDSARGDWEAKRHAREVGTPPPGEGD